MLVTPRVNILDGGVLDKAEINMRVPTRLVG